MLQERVGLHVLCAAVVKADGYGLGAREIAPALAQAGCRLFFVAQLDEAIALRAVLPGAEIAVLNGLLPRTASDYRGYRLVPVLNDLAQIAEWAAFCAETAPAPAILQLDTGMSRLGLPRTELDRFAADPTLLAGFPLRAVMSHLACADEPDHPQNPEQLRRFAEARVLLPPAPTSLAASSGILLGSAYHFDIVRPGVALYGVNPLPGASNPMRQVVALKAKILQVRDVDAGGSVGYGATHRMERAGRIATIAAGYADGLLRSLSNRGSAVLGGHKVPVVGRVSMDLITLDVTSVAPTLAVPGALVELLGSGHDVDALAAEAGTIGYEILTALGRRYHRVWR